MSVGGINLTPAASAATAAAATAGTSTAATGPMASADQSSSTQKATSASAAKTMASQLSTPDLFLKLLMAELEHEDPTNPTTPSSILQQTAELSQVESITTMTTTLNQERRYAAAGDATGLIGRQVTAVVTGTELTGTVSQVALTTSGTPFLLIGSTYVPLASVVEVNAPSTASQPATAATLAAGTTSSTTGITT